MKTDAPPPLQLKGSLDPPWDELREQRVLGRVMEARHEAPRSARRRVVVGAAAFAIAAAAALLVVFTRPHDAGKGSPVASSTAMPVTPRPTEQVMTLADGSEATMVHEAGVQVEEQRADRVRIVQQRGEVRYDVRANPARDFRVRAGGTTIHVNGTIFAVNVSGEFVEVRVERGKAEVTDSGGTRDLLAGESLRVPVGPVATLDAGAGEPDVTPEPTARAIPSAASLQAEADAARVAGKNDDAAAALRRLVALHPRDERVPGALFTLGRVERARGREDDAARAYEKCVAAAPKGPLAQDALAEAAVTWSNAGVTSSARADAAKYLARSPEGPSAARMRAIVGP